MIKKDLFKIFGDMQKILSDIEEYPPELNKKEVKDIDRSLEVIVAMTERIGDGIRKFVRKNKSKG